MIPRRRFGFVFVGPEAAQKTYRSGAVAQSVDLVTHPAPVRAVAVFHACSVRAAHAMHVSGCRAGPFSACEIDKPHCSHPWPFDPCA